MRLSGVCLGVSARSALGTSASARSRGDRHAQRLLAIEAARALGEDAISLFRTQTF